MYPRYTQVDCWLSAIVSSATVCLLVTSGCNDAEFLLPNPSEVAPVEQKTLETLMLNPVNSLVSITAMREGFQIRADDELDDVKEMELRQELVGSLFPIESWKCPVTRYSGEAQAVVVFSCGANPLIIEIKGQKKGRLVYAINGCEYLGGNSDAFAKLLKEWAKLIGEPLVNDDSSQER